MIGYKSPVKINYIPAKIDFTDDYTVIDDLFLDGDNSFNRFAKKVANDADDMISDILQTEIRESLNLDIDFDELKKALEYDRHQYEQGFNDGKIARDNEIIRCKDCIHYKPETHHCIYEHYMEPDDFCSYAESESDLKDILG